MAGLIKKQILKHLSKFAKNLSADSIHLSTLRGEGELNNLELDCVAIQNLVDLPTWLQINHAKCNRVHVKIPWTKLKTAPITIFLDTVDLDMVACEKPRPPNGPSPIQASASSGDSSYGFIVKVLEGMAVRIHSINVNFKSAVFKAEFQLSQLMIYSTDPEGKKADLRFTRILNNAWGQVLTFKKVTWQTMRIVTDAATLQTGGLTTPIRLITNQATVSITLRRKISDLSILASRLHIQFDDLLWVLTDAQIQSALLCVKSIRETIERSQQQRRSDNVNAAQTTQTISPPITPNVDEASLQPPNDVYFMRYIIHETSFHGDIDRIDLHICDDGSNANKEATYKKVVEGGAILITLHGLKMDHYPHHKAGKSRTHFRDYSDTAAARDKWAEEIIVKFRKDFIELKKAAVACEAPKTSVKLQENCLLFRLTDIEVGQVSSVTDKERSSKKLFSSQRKELLLPDDMPLATAIVTDYYFPDNRDYPAPHNNIFVKINAPHLQAHWPSLLWLNQLSLSTMKSVQRMLEDLGVVIGGGDPKDEEHVDIRIEALMPKIFIPSSTTSDDPNVPEGIEIEISQAIVTNCRHGENSSFKSLSKILHNMKESFINKNTSSFPSEKDCDFDPFCKLLEDHSMGFDSPIKRSLAAGKPQLKALSLKRKSYQDIWSVWIRQIWLSFILKDQNSKSQPFPFIDSVPIVMWICKTDANFQSTKSLTSQSADHKHVCSSSRSTPTTTPKRDHKGKIAKSQSEDCLNSQTTLLDDPPAVDANFPINGDDGNSDVIIPDETTKSDRPRRSKLLDFYHHVVEDPDIPQPPVPKIGGPAGTYVMINCDKVIRLMLDHYQFLFLLRLAESIENIGKKVSKDSSTIFSDPISNSDAVDTANTPEHQPLEVTDSTAVRLLLPSAELHLILRPTDNVCSTELSTNRNPSSPQKQNMKSAELPPFYSKTRSTSEPVRPSTPNSSECSSIDTVSILGDDISSLSIFSPIQSCSVEDTPLGAVRERAPLFLPTSGSGKNTSDPSAALRKKTEGRLQTKMQELSPLTSSMSCENVSNRFGASNSSGYDTGSHDSISLMMSQEDDCQSTTSSGTNSLDQFVFLDMESSSNISKSISNPESSFETTLFSNNQTVDQPKSFDSARMMTDSQVTVVEEDAVAKEDDQSEETLDRSAKIPESSMVSIFRIKAQHGVEVAVDSHSDNSSIRIVAQQVSFNEMGNITRDGVMDLFSSPAANSSTKPTKLNPPNLRMRIDSGPCATRFYESSDGHMTIEAEGLKEKVLTSTLTNIGAFLEDEVAPEVLPMRITARNVNLTIEDDASPVYSTTVQAPPVVLNVQEANVRIDDAGIFHIETKTSTSAAKDILTPLSAPIEHDVALPMQTANPIVAERAVEETPKISNGSESDIESDCVTTSNDLLHKPQCHHAETSVDGGAATDVILLRKQLDDITMERDTLVIALNKMQDDLVMSEREKSKLQSQLHASS